jgi:hypothetical protein
MASEFTFKIDSYPTMDPVVADVVVFGTLVAMEPTTKVPSYQIFIDATKAGEVPMPDKVIIASGTERWTAIVPLAVLLKPNGGPGKVCITAIAELKDCPDAKQPATSSGEFMVAYPPPPADAAPDGP